MKTLRLILLPLAILGLPLSSSAQTVEDYIELIEACQNGDLGGVKAGLAKGIEIDQPDGDEYTPLIHALRSRQIEVARYLIQQGANVDQRAERKSNVLFYAVATGDPGIVELILQRGAKPDEGHPSPAPMEGALTLGNLEILKLLREYGGRLDRDAIYTAALNRNPEIVEYLLEEGAAPNALSSEGLSLLGIAAWSNDPVLAKLALKHGADPNLINGSINYYRGPFSSRSNRSPHTALSAAVHKNHLAMVKRLLAAGADPKRLDNQAIKYADLVGDREIYNLLLEHGAQAQGPYAFSNLDFGIKDELQLPQAESVAPGEGQAFDLQMIANRKPAGVEPEIPSKPIVVAVLPTDEQSRKTEPLITAAFSELDFVQLVERAELQKLLGEQRLSFHSLQDAGASVTRGNLLGADALVVLAATEAGPEAYFVATSTGLIADSLHAKPGNPTQWAKTLSESFTSRARVFSTSRSEWTLIATPNIVPTRGTAANVSYAKNLNKALGLSLGLQKDVFILERRQMDRLVREKTLNEDMRAFFGSGWHVEGTSEMPATPSGPVKITIHLKSAGNADPESFTLSGSSGEPNTLMERLTSEVMKRVTGKQPAQWSASEEAEKFAAEARRNYQAALWYPASHAAEAAWALGARGNDTLECRVVSNIQRMKTAYGISFLSDRLNRSYMYPENIFQLLAPSLTDPKDPRELDDDKFIQLAHELLGIYGPILTKGRKMSPFEQDLLAISHVALRVANYPLELLQPLSDQDRHQMELDLLRRRIRDACMSAMEAARDNEMPRLYCELWSVYMHHLPYLIPHRERLKAEAKKQFNDLENWGPRYSQSFALWNFLELVEPFTGWPAGYAGRFWQQYARTLAGHTNPEVRLLGLHLSQEDAPSTGEKIDLLSSLKDAFQEYWGSDTSVIGYRSRMNIIERAFKRVPTIKGLRNWQTRPHIWLRHGLNSHPYRDDQRYGCDPYMPLTIWKVPDTLGPAPAASSSEKVTASFRQELMNMRKERLELMAHSGGARFWYKFFLAFSPEEAKELEPLLQQTIKKIENRSHALSEPKIIREFREEFVEDEYNPVLAKAESPASGIDPGSFHIPYLQYRKLAPDLRLPGPKDHLRSGARWQTNVLSIPNAEDALVVSGTGGYLMLFDPVSRSFHGPLLLPEPLMVRGNSSALGYDTTAGGKVLAVQVEYQRGKEDYFYGIACYNLQKKEWKLFQSPEFSYESTTIVGIHSLVILNNHLYYSFASGPDEEGGNSSRNFLQKATTTTGIKKLNLATGKETFLANPRRNPPRSPLDGTKWQNRNLWLSRISDTKLRASNYVYDESRNEWEDVSGTPPVTVNMQTHLLWKNYSIGWANYNPASRVLTLEVDTVQKDTQRGLKYKGSSKIDLELSLDPWENLKIPAEYPEVRHFYQVLKEEGMLDYKFWPKITPQGIYLPNRLGFYFIPKDQLIEAVEEVLMQ